MVITNVNQVVYRGDGVTTAFPFTFRIIDATDIKLLLIDADGTETDIQSDYFVDTVNNTVHYPGYAPGAEPPEADQPAPVQTGQKLVIYRELPITQEKNLGDKWPFFVIELALDKLTMILQQIYGWWGRTLKFGVGWQVDHPDFDTTIPVEAGKTWRVNDEGTGFVATGDPDEAVVVANNAKEVADAAALVAAGAKTTAEGIAGTAQDAKDIAQDAKTVADDAKDVADGIAATAQEALDTVNTLVETVDDTLSGFADDLKEKATWCTSVSAMKSDTGLATGMVVATKGYYIPNDGGAAVYTIRARTGADVDDGGSVIFLNNNNLVAELLKDNTISVKQFGAIGDGLTDDTTKFENAIKAAEGKTLLIPQATYTLTEIVIADGVADVRDHGTYNNHKPIYPNNDLVFKGWVNMEHKGQLPAVSGYWAQGCCYNSSTGKYIVAINHETNTSQKLLVVDPSTLAVEETHDFTTLGHANTLAYVEETDEIYVCTGNNNERNVSIVDASAWTVKREVVDILDGENLFGFKYDPICKVFYAFNHNYWGLINYYLLDLSLNIIKKSSFRIPTNESLGSNGLLAYNGSVLIFFFDRIVDVDYFGNVKKVTTHRLREEFEDMDMTPYGIYISCNNAAAGYGIYRYKENEISPNGSMYPNSIETKYTPLNTDLNTLVDAGMYWVGTDVTEDSLNVYHFPDAFNGYLIVMRRSDKLANGFVKQIFFRHGDGGGININNWHTYVRIYDGTMWSNWTRIDSGLIQKGWAAIDIPANSYNDLTINFSTPFPKAPYVQVTMQSGSPSMDYAHIVLAVKEVTTSKFVIRAWNGGSTGRSPGVFWRATER